MIEYRAGSPEPWRHLLSPPPNWPQWGGNQNTASDQSTVPENRNIQEFPMMISKRQGLPVEWNQLRQLFESLPPHMKQYCSNQIPMLDRHQIVPAETENLKASVQNSAEYTDSPDQASPHSAYDQYKNSLSPPWKLHSRYWRKPCRPPSIGKCLIHPDTMGQQFLPHYSTVEVSHTDP